MNQLVPVEPQTILVADTHTGIIFLYIIIRKPKTIVSGIDEVVVFSVCTLLMFLGFA